MDSDTNADTDTDAPADVRTRAYDPATDRSALWHLKRGFELGLGEGTGEDAKRERYETKLDERYRDGYLEWVDRCLEAEPNAVTIAAVDSSEQTADGSEVDDLVGYVFVLPESMAYIWDSAVLNELYVAPDYRGTGVADRLMERALEIVADQDLPLERLVLDVDRDNDRAKAFYDQYGFEHWGEMVVRPVPDGS